MLGYSFDLLPRDLEFISQQAYRTPMRSSSELNARIGCTVHVKDETLQRSGSFKFRGAILGVRNASQGIVAAGAGNFPIAVGLAAQTLGKPACLIMPSDAPAFKLEQARRTGADIQFAERSQLAERAETEAGERNWRNLHAFEDIEMIAGSFTLGLEIAAAMDADNSNSDAVVVACGGGGLAAGVALALRSRSISAEIYVVEPETHPRYARARAGGAPIRIDPVGDTSCDALRSRKVGARAFEILENSNVEVCAVSDRLVEDACRLLRKMCGIQAEPSGAVALAAVLGGVVTKKHTRTWVIACGGNAEPEC
ncbi:pyridoxal-phosphate dependent enzyme [Bradyrhizobium sp. Pear77]|uniref:pyridoxal-phosphate dependent enzyme n=1 Tax=Bradyrhizobium altum TaxID=1571202 RepID=UPI001E3D8C76|nr:pyridoxal-phosphate dependent enzyme [Bradyrhizobium altum]MCC8952975.1 pyridoxal-phosphate dependent enzyme [Bradyrhizobium altum]